MKGRNSTARPHVVPITPEIEALLNDLPRFAGREYLFSTNGGKLPGVDWRQDQKAP